MAWPLSRSKKHQAEPGRRRPAAVGSTGAFSYYASKRSNLSQNRPLEGRNTGTAPKKPRFDLTNIRKNLLGQQLGTALLAIVLVASIISILQVDTSPRVVMLNSTKQYALHAPSDYQKIVTNSMRSSLLNSNKVTVNTKGVVEQLRQNFPEIYDASMVLPLVGHRPTVYIELTRPALVLQTPNTSAVIDVRGRLLMASRDTTSYAGLKLPVVEDQSSLDLKVGDVALSSANVEFVQDVVRQFDSQHITLKRLVLPAGKEELDVYPAGVSYYVKFNLHETTSRQQAGTYFAVHQQLTKQGITPKQYIDVRLVGRAYYL